MSRAASATRSIASRSGAWETVCGATPYRCSRITRTSSTLVRELESNARVRISAAGREETSKMLRTGAVTRDARAGDDLQILPGQFE